MQINQTKRSKEIKKFYLKVKGEERKMQRKLKSDTEDLRKEVGRGFRNGFYYAMLIFTFKIILQI